MINTQLIATAFKKAQDNGWKPEYHKALAMVINMKLDNNEPLVKQDYYHHLFTVGFAKHFWGHYFKAETDETKVRAKIPELELLMPNYVVEILDDKGNDLNFIPPYHKDFDADKVLCALNGPDIYLKNPCDSIQVLMSPFPAYQYHLQMMVIQENPIEYLQQFL